MLLIYLKQSFEIVQKDKNEIIDKFGYSESF